MKKRIITIAFPDTFTEKDMDNCMEDIANDLPSVGGRYASVEINIFDRIRLWAKERGIYAKGDPKTQLLKTGEEFGELCKAVLSNNVMEKIDALGDTVVTLTNLAELSSLKIEDCIESAYEVIKNRKGSMQGGTFVKE